MTATALLIAAALLGQARAVVELSCSDNATCIENLAREFVRNVRQQKTVRLFNTLTVEPLGTRQARSNEGLIPRILNNNAFSFDWNDYTFRIWKDQNRNDGALDLEVWESRTAKDVSEEVPKKSKSKVGEEEEEEEEDVNKLTPKPKGPIRRRRAKKKIMQAVIPMLFGMKSAAVVIFAMAVVTVLTLKAFVASKLALMVTVGMAIKRLYESYSMGGLGLAGGVGLQNHPYLYSQYPIDFPSASSHAYSVSGMSPQFPEMYNPTAMGTHQQNELLQQNDASAQQSQEAPSVQLLNSTRATERWDGKSKLQKLLEPIVEGLKQFIDPISNIFYSMPATFRGLSSDVTTMKTVGPEEDKKEVRKPKEILVPQPRNIRAQRKMIQRKAPFESRPKKYTELKVDLDKLKKNKDLYDYVKTKKYKYNYQNTYYYPRVKYFVNPNMFVVKPKNNRLVPYRKENIFQVPATIPNRTFNVSIIPLSDWKPIVLVPVLTQNITRNPNITQALPINNNHFAQNASGFSNGTNFYKRKVFYYPKLTPTANLTQNLPETNIKFAQNATSFVNVTKNVNKKPTNFDNKKHRVKRSIEINSSSIETNDSDSSRNEDGFQISISGRGFMKFLEKLSDADPITGMVNYATKYTKSAIKHSLKHATPPYYYSMTYELLMMTLDVIDGLVQVHDALSEHFLDDIVPKKKKTHVHAHSHANAQNANKNKKKKKRKGKPNKKPNHGQSNLQNQQQTLSQTPDQESPITLYLDSKIRDKRE